MPTAALGRAAPLVAEALGLGSAMESLLEIPGAKPLNFEPSLTISLDEGCRRQARLMIEGVFAKMMYLSLYKMHELALHGWTKVVLDTLARLILRRTEPHVKLH